MKRKKAEERAAQVYCLLLRVCMCKGQGNAPNFVDAAIYRSNELQDGATSMTLSQKTRKRGEPRVAQRKVSSIEAEEDLVGCIQVTLWSRRRNDGDSAP